NRTREQINAEIRAGLASEVDQLFEDAANVDAEEDRLFGERRGDELPEELTDPRTRSARLDAAVRELDVQDAVDREADDDARRSRAEKEATAATQRRRVTGRKPPGFDPVADAQEALEFAQRRAAEHRARVEAKAAAEGRRPKGPAPTMRGDVKRALARLEAAKAEAA